MIFSQLCSYSLKKISPITHLFSQEATLQPHAFLLVTLVTIKHKTFMKPSLEELYKRHDGMLQTMNLTRFYHLSASFGWCLGYPP